MWPDDKVLPKLSIPNYKGFFKLSAKKVSTLDVGVVIIFVVIWKIYLCYAYFIVLNYIILIC